MKCSLVKIVQQIFSGVYTVGTVVVIGSIVLDVCDQMLKENKQSPRPPLLRCAPPSFAAAYTARASVVSDTIGADEMSDGASHDRRCLQW